MPGSVLPSDLMLAIFFVLQALVKLDLFHFSILQRAIFQLFPSHVQGQSLLAFSFSLSLLSFTARLTVTLCIIYSYFWQTFAGGYPVYHLFRNDCLYSADSFNVLFQGTLSLS